MEQAIGIFSFDWWAWITPTFGVIAVVLYSTKRADLDKIRYIQWSIAGILFLSATLIHPYLYFSGKWSVQTSLPFHMCTMAQWLAIFALIKPRQWLFDILVFWGIAGGINALLSPQPLHGGEFQVLLEYFIEHGGIVLTPMFLAMAYQMRPSKNSWIRIFLATQLVLIVIAAFNFFSGSNYFFLFQKPIAHSPFIIGDWPYYLIGFQMIGLLQFYTIYYLFQKPALLASSNNELSRIREINTEKE